MLRRFIASLAILVFLSGQIAMVQAEGLEPVGLDLVLALDGSHSMKGDNFREQIASHAAAFRDDGVIEAIIHDALWGRISVSLFVWSGEHSQRSCEVFFIVDSHDSGEELARTIENVCGRSYLGGGTSISGALSYARDVILARSPYRNARKVIDISGDEPSHGDSAKLIHERMQTVASGVTINGLAIDPLGPAKKSGKTLGKGLLWYYKNAVIGGPGAFALPADRGSYETALIAKLIREIRDPAPFVERGKEIRGSSQKFVGLLQEQ